MFEVQGGSTCGPSTLWRSEVAVPMVRRCFSRGCSVSLVVTPGRDVTLVASACVDSAGSAGVVFGLTRVMVEAFSLFRCFVVLCSRSMGGGVTFRVPGGGPGGR
ncbi:hypothetical protein Taro_052333, partial [Colocasia esculenta]|nr:hypothetical protein [Colocasia esculenta]